jgi:hypothetical protein
VPYQLGFNNLSNRAEKLPEYTFLTLNQASEYAISIFKDLGYLSAPPNASQRYVVANEQGELLES